MEGQPRLAGVGSRAAAVLVDGALVFVGLGLVVGSISGQTYSGGGSHGFRLHGGASVAWLLLAYLYWIVLEAVWGTTVGKRLLNLRVVDEAGGAISWGQSAGRNLLRLVDGFPYVLPYLVGGVLAVGDDRKRRLGDRAAHTLVVYRD